MIEYNTMISTAGLTYTPVDTYGTPIGSFKYSNNVIVANTEQYETLYPTWEQRPLVIVSRYGSDAYYNKTVPFMTFDDNCYIYNGENNENAFDLFSLGESYGAAYNFTEWQAEGFDKNSFITDPMTDAYFVATSPSCKSKGYTTFSSSSPSSPSSGSSPSPALSPSKPSTSTATLTLASGLYFIALCLL